MEIDVKNLGPIAKLAGVWEGAKGEDIAPSDDRGIENNRFQERMTFELLSPVFNHEQILHGLRYNTRITRLGETASFHEEVGYWLWDPKAEEVYRCFIIPRGISVMASGKAKADSEAFELTALAGTDTNGICSNPFLDREFKTVRFEFKIKFHSPNSFSYEEISHLKIKGQEKIFSHSDKNSLTRVS